MAARRYPGESVGEAGGSAERGRQGLPRPNGPFAGLKTAAVTLRGQPVDSSPAISAMLNNGRGRGRGTLTSAPLLASLLAPHILLVVQPSEKSIAVSWTSAIFGNRRLRWVARSLCHGIDSTRRTETLLSSRSSSLPLFFQPVFLRPSPVSLLLSTFGLPSIFTFFFLLSSSSLLLSFLLFLVIWSHFSFFLLLFSCLLHSVFIISYIIYSFVSRNQNFFSSFLPSLSLFLF